MSPESDRAGSRESPAVSIRWEYSIDASMPVGGALAIILATLVAVIEETEQGVIERRSEESLHDYRVAVRRMRSALSLFGEDLPESVLRTGRKLFKDLGRRTTQARDLDVLFLELPGYVEALASAERSGLAELEGRIGREIEREYASMSRWLAGNTYRRKMASWRGDLERLAASNEGEPISRRAAAVIRKAAERTEVLAGTLATENPGAALHRLRIRFKRLRYALEFASPLSPAGEVNGVIMLLKQLQDQLGSHQDLLVHGRLIATFCLPRDADADADLSPLGRRLGEVLAGRRERLRASIETQAPAFEAALTCELDRALTALETR